MLYSSGGNSCDRIFQLICDFVSAHRCHGMRSTQNVSLPNPQQYTPNPMSMATNFSVPIVQLLASCLTSCRAAAAIARERIFFAYLLGRASFTYPTSNSMGFDVHIWRNDFPLRIRRTALFIFGTVAASSEGLSSRFVELPIVLIVDGIAMKTSAVRKEK